MEAPVLGSIPEATTGKLIVMIGGTREQFDHWRSLLSKLGSNVLYVGPVGHAAALKLAMNQLIASLTTAFATSLAFIQLHDLRVEQFMDVVRGSALYAPTFDKKLDKMIDHNYDNPNFPLKHLTRICACSGSRHNRRA